MQHDSRLPDFPPDPTGKDARSERLRRKVGAPVGWRTRAIDEHALPGKRCQIFLLFSNDRANDAFPAIGTIDYADLSQNSCRFDMAQNISPQDHLRNDPGDSIVFTITAVRSASRINATEIRWKLKPNHLFDPYRTSVYGLATEGSAAGENATGDNYAFDLPDENFLFPGDILHYYIYAEDKVGGSDIGFSLYPADQLLLPKLGG